MRKKLIAVIHIAKNQARICDMCKNIVFEDTCHICKSKTRPMSEIDYRRFLIQITGHSSSKLMSDEQLKRVVSVFESKGFKRIKKSSLHKSMNSSRMAMIENIRKDAEIYLGRNWKKRINGFCRKTFNVSALEFCSFKQLRSIWGFMRRQAE